MKLAEEFVLLDEREQQHAPAVQRLALLAVHDGGRESAVLVRVIAHGQADLPQRSGGAVGLVADVPDERDCRDADEEAGRDNDARLLGHGSPPA